GRFVDVFVDQAVEVMVDALQRQAADGAAGPRERLVKIMRARRKLHQSFLSFCGCPCKAYTVDYSVRQGPRGACADCRLPAAAPGSRLARIHQAVTSI